jgi:hypothetical protein
MASAAVTLKVSTTEFDMLREAVQFRLDAAREKGRDLRAKGETGPEWQEQGSIALACEALLRTMA